MTHEQRANGEHQHGPEHDHDLPDAGDVPVSGRVEDSDLPPLPVPADVDGGSLWWVGW